MATVNPYLTFHGNCEEAFHLYKSVFGCEFTNCSKFNEMQTMSEKKGNLIMHVSLPISA